MKAFYVDRSEDLRGKGVYTVMDYYTRRPICVLVMHNDSTNELYADRIAKALNQLMSKEEKQ